MNVKIERLGDTLRDELSQITNDIIYFESTMLAGIKIDGLRLRNIYTFFNIELDDNTIEKLLYLHRYNIKLHMMGYDNLIFNVFKHYSCYKMTIRGYISSKNRLPSTLTIPKYAETLVLGKIDKYSELKEINLPDNIGIEIEWDSYSNIKFNNIENISSITAHSSILPSRCIKVNEHLELNNIDMEKILYLWVFNGLKELVINESCNLTKINCDFIKEMSIVLNSKINYIELNNHKELKEINIYTPLECLNIKCEKRLEIISLDTITIRGEKLRHFRLIKNS